MKKNTCLIVGTVLLIFVWTNTCFAADKIGFVNIQEIIQNSNAGKKEGEVLKKWLDGKQSNIKPIEDELQKMKTDLEKQSSVMTASARSEKEAAYQRKLRDYQIFVEDTNKELQRRNQEMAQKLFPGITKVIHAIGENEKYTMILEISAFPPFFYFNKANDITKKVIEDFNKIQTTK